MKKKKKNFIINLTIHGGKEDQDKHKKWLTKYFKEGIIKVDKPKTIIKFEIGELSIDVLFVIFEFISPWERIHNLGRVNKLFNSIVHSPWFFVKYKFIKQEAIKINDDYDDKLNSFLNQHEELKLLDICNCVSLRTVKNSFSKKRKNIKTIKLDRFNHDNLKKEILKHNFHVKFEYKKDGITEYVVIQDLREEKWKIGIPHYDITIEQLKELCYEYLGYRPDEQRMISRGRGLEDGRTLNDYRIGKGEVIHLVLRLRG